ncbi:MAG: hypothetical protein EA382_11105 [Spirochaetaceae bacterium]|nr:MAG: hypothetical protein EA382_11105 [Spirochaetaceae bacterium]
MRIAKLALRLVAEHRTSLGSMVTGLALVAATATVSGAIATSLHAGWVEMHRTASAGEYTAVVDAHVATRIVDSRSDDAVVSVVVQEIGTLDVYDQLVLALLTYSDLSAETAYRRIAGPDDVRVRDAVIVARDQRFASLVGRVARLTGADGEPLFVRVRSVVHSSSDAIEVIVHQPARLDGDVTLRVYGARGALTPDRAATIAPDLVSTGSAARGSATIGPIRRRIAVLIAAIAAMAVAVLIPGQLVFAQRTASIYRLLTSWGFAPGTVKTVALCVGAYVAAVASSFGAVGGLAIVAIANAQSIPAEALLPFEWAHLIAAPPQLAVMNTAVETAVTPSIGSAIAVVIASTLLGAVTAWPAMRFAATLGVRRGQWE